jgi:GT2 family glycosyltransferase
MKLRAFPPILLRELWLRITSNVFGLPSMLRAENLGSDISMLDEPPVICVCMLYHSLKGGVLVEALKSVEQLDYPRDRLMLLLVDNYSRDGAFEYVRGWLDGRRWAYLRVVHVRARGAPARLRNIGLLIALKADIKYFSFIDSDIIADPLLLRRLLSVMRGYSSIGPVFSVSSVWDVGFDNLDWLERLRVRWMKARKGGVQAVSVGEAVNTAACLIHLDKVKKVGFFDEDILFIEDLDWGRRATRKGFVCLFDKRVVLRHLRKYSLREFRKYFFKGALSEAKLFLKNGIAWRAVRSALYWDAVLAALLFSWFTPVPLALVVLLGFVTYFRRCVGLGRLLLYPVSMPFSVAKSVALTGAMLYWVLRGGYKTEKVTVLGEPDWEVVS